MAIAANTGTATSAAKISDINLLVAAINVELALYATKASVDDLKAKVVTLEGKAIPPDLSNRVTALEAKPTPVDLTDRVAALEEIVASFRTPPAATAAGDPMATIPTTRRPRDPSEGVELIYDKATLYYGDMELHALRTAEDTWRLVAQLNYITVNQIIWTYDETIRGTPSEVYAHASARLIELAGLKTSHDAAHKRVREMSEGRP